jgi:hypothetical protein
MSFSAVQNNSSARSTLLHEPHYTVNELAKNKHLSAATVRRMFQDEAGVFKYESPHKRRKRGTYVTLRIPASVAERVFAKYYRTWND